ncbi:MAG: hypothetical protein MR878_03160 [Campylobacter sp.]|nr:hypothetical protein [Campylobacter sp.]
MTQIILEFPSFLLASSAAGLMAGSVRWCFCVYRLGILEFHIEIPSQSGG